MNAEEVAMAVSLTRARAGLRLAPEKTYFIESRLAPVARREGFESVSDLLAAIRARRDEALIWAAVEALAAGETCFFRDRTPFVLFKTELAPQLAAARRGRSVRIWSAACATGQEIYSLAMLADELAMEDPELQIELAASDLSGLALERAQSGLYDQFEIQRGLPIRRLVRYFEKVDDHWRICPEVRRRVRWRRINLVAGLKAIGRFDVVFCRYVLSSMTEEAQRKVAQELAGVLAEDGFLVLGLKESVAGLGEAFQPVVGRPGLYRRNPAFRAAAA
ncbi:MAG: protein-glutamate O-methyltransferase CheR [Caulobacteraceae bacterium]|nr:protein-glutamate O-methyltransferase CheR [Caulobacteraceae bacterium]